MSELDDVQTTVGVIDGLRARIAELEAANAVSFCVFCGNTMEKDLTVMLEHAKGCEDRPENRLMGRIAELEAELAERDRIAQALVDKMHHVHDSAKYQAVWTLWQTHSAPYTGPQYEHELAALEAELRGRAEEGKP